MKLKLFYRDGANFKYEFELTVPYDLEDRIGSLEIGREIDYKDDLKLSRKKFHEIIGTYYDEEYDHTTVEIVDIIRFPNGFISWAETHHEIVTMITDHRIRSHPPKIIAKIQENEGFPGFCRLAINWADEFEQLHEGREWDGEFFDEIEKFVNSKLSK